MTGLDWGILILFPLGLLVAALYTRPHAGSVSGFLAANRCAGRYLIAVAYGMAQLGVISLVWYWQQNYDVAFTSIFWGLMEGPAMIIIALSGWVIYRYRQTRAMTLAQFFEMRYSRKFRVFAGLVAFGSGIINYGIFPAVAARFFIALCGLPDAVMIGETTIGTFPLLMGLMLGIALLFVFIGGQVAVIVTDFLQGSFANVVFLAVIAYILWVFPWSRIETALLAAPEGRSLVDPFDLGKEENFNVWYWVISVIVLFYGMMGWQGESGYRAAALNAHEAKMANILNGWRFRVLMLITLVLPIAIRVVMTDPAYADQAETHQRLHQRATDRGPGRRGPHPGRGVPDPAGGPARPVRRRASGRVHLHQRHLPAFLGFDLHPGRGAALQEEAAFSEGASAAVEMLDLRGRDLRVHLQHALHPEPVHRDVPGADRCGLRRRGRQCDHRWALLETRHHRRRVGGHDRGHEPLQQRHHPQAAACNGGPSRVLRRGHPW